MASRPIIATSEDFVSAVTLGQTLESEFLDFKERYDTSPNSRDKRELRKDATALANTWGGVLLIGVAEKKLPDGRSRAESLRSVDDRMAMEWIANVLAEKVHPPISYHVRPITLPDPSTSAAVGIIAINVEPNRLGLSCVENDSDHHGISVPYRDAYGVKYYHAVEAMRHLSSPSRRVEVLVHELVARGKEVRVTTPVLRLRRETETERDERLKAEVGNYSFKAQHRPAHLQARINETYDHNAIAYFGEVGRQQVQVTIDRVCFAIPFGAIRELWEDVDTKLAIALECELVIDETQGEKSGFVRFRGA